MKIPETSPWVLGQEVEFTSVLIRGNVVEYDERPAPRKHSDEIVIDPEDWLPRYRRGRIYNRWAEHECAPQRGILVQLTQRRDTEVIRSYGEDDTYARVMRTHRVALVATSLRTNAVIVPLESLRRVERQGEDSEALP